MRNFDGVCRLDMVQYGGEKSIKSRNCGIQDLKSASEHERGGCVVGVLEADVAVAHYFRFAEGGELRGEIDEGEPDRIIVCGVGGLGDGRMGPGEGGDGDGGEGCGEDYAEGGAASLRLQSIWRSFEMGMYGWGKVEYSRL